MNSNKINKKNIFSLMCFFIIIMLFALFYSCYIYKQYIKRIISSENKKIKNKYDYKNIKKQRQFINDIVNLRIIINKKKLFDNIQQQMLANVFRGLIVGWILSGIKGALTGGLVYGLITPVEEVFRFFG